MFLAICKEYPLSAPTEIGSYHGFKMEVFYDTAMLIIALTFVERQSTRWN